MSADVPARMCAGGTTRAGISDIGLFVGGGSAHGMGFWRSGQKRADGTAVSAPAAFLRTLCRAKSTPFITFIRTVSFLPVVIIFSIPLIYRVHFPFNLFLHADQPCRRVSRLTLQFTILSSLLCLLPVPFALILILPPSS